VFERGVNNFFYLCVAAAAAKMHRLLESRRAQQ
jgi:hypothetical protein